MRVELYRYMGIPQVINKNLGEPYREISNAAFNQPYSLMNPVLNLTHVDGTIGGDMTQLFYNQGINYVCIQHDILEAPKYYFIMDYEYRHNDHVVLTLHLDVLMTYKDEIKKFNVMLDRSSESEDLDAVDNMMPLSSNEIIERIDLPSSISDDENLGTYVLVTSQNQYRLLQ